MSAVVTPDTLCVLAFELGARAGHAQGALDWIGRDYTKLLVDGVARLQRLGEASPNDPRVVAGVELLPAIAAQMRMTIGCLEALKATLVDDVIPELRSKVEALPKPD